MQDIGTAPGNHYAAEAPVSYAGNFVLRGGEPLMFRFNGGYASIDSVGNTMWHHYTTDHLGSVRAVADGNGNIEQVNHYYPFGGTFGDAGYNASLQPYKYNAKHFETHHGLKLYDHGARLYDAAMAMWTSFDSMAEKAYNISPYAHCNANPVNRIDSNGKFSTKLQAEAARYIYSFFSFDDVGNVIYNPEATDPLYRYTFNSVSMSGGDYIVANNHLLDRTYVDYIQAAGDGLALAGYLATLSVVGAEAGVPMAWIGNVISRGAAWIGFIVDMINSDSWGLGSFATYSVINKVEQIGIKKLFRNGFYEKWNGDYDIGAEIFKQSSNMKTTVLNYSTNELIERNHE